MPRWLKKRLGLWLCRMMEADPELFVPWTCVARHVEVRIVGKRVWIDTEAGCRFRASALGTLRVVNENDEERGGKR